MRVGALAAACRVTQPGMTRLVELMAAAGLVEKRPDPADARAAVIQITDSGSAARRAWIDTVGEVLAPKFAGLSDEDWAAIRTTAALLNARTDLMNGAE